jgi:hypothetical protein
MLKLLKRAFQDFYGHDYVPKVYVENRNSRISPTENNVCVHNSVFHDCVSSSNGGAIYCGSSVYKLLVEQSSFLSCQSSGTSGGGICFDSTTEGQCVLSKICGFKCVLTSSSSSNILEGQLAYIKTKSDITYKSHVNDSTSTQSSKVSSKCYNAFCHYYGNILHPNVNISNNECYSNAAVYFSPTSSSTCRISYSTVINNTANGSDGCISLSSSNIYYYIDSCNILNNTQTTNNNGIIHSTSNIHIKDSCILGNNKGNRVFSTSYTMTISNCTIDDDIFTST